MTDARQSILDEAWGLIPQTHETTAGTGSFTRTRVERIISIAIGFGSLALGAQALLTALGSTDENPGWHVPLMVAIFAPLLVMIVACLVGRGAKIAAGLFAMVYLGCLAVWPVATAGSTPAPTHAPWIWYLVNIATVAAVLAFPLPLQIVWTGLVPLVYGFVRLVMGGFGPEDLWIAVALDVSFALILGGVLLSLGWVFRSVASNVDRTRAYAVESYAAAAAADAAEKERVAVAALMHDSVLAALIAAERAASPRERTLAIAMAREALTRLANTEQDSGEGTDEPTDAGAIADAVERGARDLGVSITVERSIEPCPASVPGRVARALVLAATQAVANAIEHAEGRGLAIAVHGFAQPAAVQIDVRDTGGGFVVDEVADDRLGIRGSIIARVAAVGGTSHIDSGHGGTNVHLEWREGER